MVLLEEDHFDQYLDKTTQKTLEVRRFTWTNENNMSVQVITYGATITSIKFPNKSGEIDDVVMGFNDMKGYLGALNPYFGATVGRVANRIELSRFMIDGKVYNLPPNLGKHMLHGGLRGFDKVNWDYYLNGTKVVMSYNSPDMDQGFPGSVVVNITFELTEDNEFNIDYKAYTTKPTYVNLTNHSYFNLAGENAGADELYKHIISINADQITEVDCELIQTGRILPVTGTVFDLRIPKVLGDVINHVPCVEGFDHNFCITKGTKQEDTFVACVYHPDSGRIMEVYSNQPGVQLYTSNSLPEDPTKYKGDPKELKTLTGKNGNYYKHGALCLETQNYPDAINHQNFPKAVLYPGEVYHHTMTLKFSLNN